MFPPIETEWASIVVTRNLHAALRHFRLPEQEQVLWADCIRIDQASLSEKLQQVRMMGSTISRSANRPSLAGRGGPHQPRSL